MDERIREKIAKLQALVDRGVGGEKENAEELLKNLCKKYNISEEEIAQEEKSERTFRFYGMFGKKLFYQVVHSVIPGTPIYKYTYKNNCNTRFIECTQAEYIEINEKFEFYRYHLDRGLGIYMEAFIQREHIFPPNAETPESYELSEEDVEILKLAGSLEKHERLLMIED